MTIQTFELDKGRRFVAGLFWQTLTRPQSLKEEVRKLANDLDFDLYLIREGTVPQVGFLSSADGATAGLMSCAAVISKSYELESGYSSALCAMQVPDGRYLLVAIRDGAILPEADFLGSEDEVEKLYTEQLSIGEWPVRVAPSHWHIDGSEEKDFSSFLPTTKSGDIEYHNWWKVLPIAGDRKRLIKILASVAIISALGMGGYYGYEQYKAKLQADETAAMEAQEQQKRSAALANIQIDHPWVSIPQPVDLMSACESNFRNDYIFAAGWQFESYSCSTGLATYSWVRTTTTLSDLKATLPGVTGDDMGEKATMDVLFALSQPQEIALLEAGHAKALFIERMQSVGLNFSLTETPVQVPIPPEAGSDFVPPMADYRAFHWAIPITVLRPNTLAAHLDIPALRIIKAASTMKDGVLSWSYEGDIYEKN